VAIKIKQNTFLLLSGLCCKVWSCLCCRFLCFSFLHLELLQSGRVSNLLWRLRTSPFLVLISASFWAISVSNWRFSLISDSISLAMSSNSAQWVDSYALISLGRKDGGTISGVRAAGRSRPWIFCCISQCKLFHIQFSCRQCRTGSCVNGIVLCRHGILVHSKF